MIFSLWLPNEWFLRLIEVFDFYPFLVGEGVWFGRPNQAGEVEFSGLYPPALYACLTTSSSDTFSLSSLSTTVFSVTDELPHPAQ